ncbi:MAG: dihydrofolate reductase [Sinobacterium sp.]|nr:dihydrofolate reductase [Sinobacterium sp.]
MKLALIVAMAENGVIGINNKLPWHLPEDLKYFKQVTMGKPIVMGRKTFESIGRPLPGRTNIVISRNKTWPAPEGVKLVANIEDAIALAESIAVNDGTTELMVIGGAQIYAAAFERADTLYLTKVHGDVEGDAYFEGFNESEWELTAQQRHEASDNNPYPYTFCVYQRP